MRRMKFRFPVFLGARRSTVSPQGRRRISSWNFWFTGCQFKLVPRVRNTPNVAHCLPWINSPFVRDLRVTPSRKVAPRVFVKQLAAWSEEELHAVWGKSSLQPVVGILSFELWLIGVFDFPINYRPDIDWLLKWSCVFSLIKTFSRSLHLPGNCISIKTIIHEAN